MIGVTRVLFHRPIALQREHATLDANPDLLSANTWQLGGQQEPLAGLPKVHRRHPARELPVHELAPAQDALEQTIEAVFENKQIVNRVPGGRAGLVPLPLAHARGHRFDSSTSTYSASMTSPGLPSGRRSPCASPPEPSVPPGAPSPGALRPAPAFWYRSSVTRCVS